MDSLKSDFDESKENVKHNINEGSNFLANMIKSTNRNNEKQPFYLDYSWKIYRVIFLIIIFLLFFVFKGVEIYLVDMNFDKFLIKVFNLVSFFALINISLYFFMVTFNRYRSTVKGKIGPRGGRGKRGLQGGNTNCDICSAKTYTMKKMYKKMPQKETIKNEDLVIDMSSPPDKGWRLLDTETTPTSQSNSGNYLNIMDNTYIGSKCSSDDTCSEIKTKTRDATDDGTYRKQKVITLQKSGSRGSSFEVTEQRPLIGVAANTQNNKITSLQYFIDNNAKHSKRRYTPQLLGSRFGNAKNIGNKNNFVCPNNSAIYKVDSISDSKGITGLKFHCQDVDTGKEVLVQDANNYKSYGYTFGREPREDDKEYFFKSVQCNPVLEKTAGGAMKQVAQFYPSFISEVSGSGNDKLVKNLKFHKCSYYKPG